MKYIVCGEMTISIHVEVEADSPEQARARADEAGVQSLCHQCAHGGDRKGEWRTSGELDGPPVITDVEESEE
jgi:hypothetical protein